MAEESTGTAGTDPKGEQEGQQSGKVTFSTEQQTVIERLIDDRYTKAFAKAEAKYKSQLDEMTAKLAEAEKAKEDRAAQSGKVKPEEYEQKIAELNKAHAEQIEKAIGKQKAILDKALKADIIGAAAKANCSAPDELADVLIARGIIQLDDDGAHAINPPEGITKIGDDGKPITLNVFIERFIGQNPHWKRFTGTGGTGSQDGGAGGKKLLTNMTPEEIGALSDAEFDKLDKEQLLKKKRPWTDPG
jgi:hypothetical protein